eukprot:scaffold141_cov410-Prasinococcus_capsulatus_cf.AAC.15
MSNASKSLHTQVFLRCPLSAKFHLTFFILMAVRAYQENNKADFDRTVNMVRKLDVEPIHVPHVTDATRGGIGEGNSCQASAQSLLQYRIVQQVQGYAESQGAQELAGLLPTLYSFTI